MTSSKSQKIASKEISKDGEKIERKRSGSLSLPSTTSGEFQVKIPILDDHYFQPKGTIKI